MSVRAYLFLGWVILIGSFFADLIIPNRIGWFPRGSAMLCLLSLIAEFRLREQDGATFREDWRKRTTDEKFLDDPMYEPDAFWKGMNLFAHISMMFGTALWAFGDLLIKKP